MSGGGNEPPVAGTRPEKSSKDASDHERIVYSTANSDGQMAVSSVPPGTIPRFSSLP
jgi:hypothetical protein